MSYSPVLPLPIAGKTIRGMETATSRNNTRRAMETRRHETITAVTGMVNLAAHTVTMTLTDVTNTAYIVDTMNTPTRSTVATVITSIKDTGMTIRATGDPGSNGTAMRRVMWMIAGPSVYGSGPLQLGGRPRKMTIETLKMAMAAMADPKTKAPEVANRPGFFGEKSCPMQIRLKKLRDIDPQ